MRLGNLLAIGLVAAVLTGCAGEKLPTPYMFAILAGPSGVIAAPGVSVAVKDFFKKGVLILTTIQILN